ncbi:DUF1905 domain-containing protein [Novosphingobium album (ex Hu et al. 2023)]|uniref:DUF1905 domain-containing protein n=1 Tax=Novosphingobium album (ex Hu et al. 2023) TaxID=2930093 RepID=A0ABT0B4A4_9SPHN|nr:DUF1905 domain-containing protein [Novosphingobium album (ex Hu et al. 2023)]MCJ2179703.1 DUF1905 domain-containing protein [Novosphingobium album (ex Hu et al. 2023)]
MIPVEHLVHTGHLWRWTGASGSGTWHFITIGGETGEALSATALMRKLEGTARGFGSLKVKARIGGTAFATSVFPSKSDNGWLLPVKASVRRAEDLTDGDEVQIFLEV